MQTFPVPPVSLSSPQYQVESSGTPITQGGAAEGTCPQAQETLSVWAPEPALEAIEPQDELSNRSRS